MLIPEPPIPFSRRLLNGYIHTIDRAYRENEDSFDPTIGHTIASFRFMLYESIKYYLPGEMKDVPGTLVNLENNAIVVREGTRSLRSYPIGTSEYDDPWTSFPTNRGGAPATAANNAQQLQLFTPDQLRSPTEAGGLQYFLGHCGRPEAGLRAVHLCLPFGGFTDERVHRYLQVWTIYRADGGEHADGPGSAPSWLPPLVTTPEPTVKLRRDPSGTDAG